MPGGKKFDRYPAPTHSTIIEPFAGGAGYSAKYSDRAVTLVERNPKIAAIWKYLLGQGARPEKVYPWLAANLDADKAPISHWQLTEGDYTAAPDIEATWFIDPPYNCPAGRFYQVGALDYAALATWCQSRQGQVIVCEQAGATWLPFQPLYGNEVIWTNS